MTAGTSWFRRTRRSALAAERTRLEAELRRLTAIIDHAADAIVTKDRSGTITEWNRGAEALYGYSREEAVGQPISMIIPAARQGEEMDLLSRALAGQVTRQHETLRQHRDGSIIDVSITVSPLYDEHGQTEGATVITREITARKQLERQLSGLFDNAPTGVALRDLDGRYLRVNEPMARIFGQPAEQMIGADPAELHPDEATRRRIQAEDAAILATGEAQTGIYSLPQADGTVRDYHAIRYPVLDPAGEVSGFGSFTLDITEQRQNERDRERVLAELAEAQEIAKVGSWIWDPQAGTGVWSAEMYRIFGRDPHAGRPADGDLTLSIHPDDRVPLERAMAVVLRTGEPLHEHFRLLTADGEERAIHVNARRESSRQLSGTVQDVTELRAVERQARDSAEHLRHVLDNAPIGMALVAPEGRWLQVNRAMCEIVGYDEEELSGLTFQDVTHPDDLDADLAQVHRLLAGEISDYRMEKRYIHKAGHEVWVQISVTLGRDEQAEPLYFIAQVQDITREREARMALAKSERRYKSIASNLPGMVYRYRRDAAGNVSLPFASAGARDVYGLEPEQLMADPSLIVSRIHPDDQSLVEASITESATQQSRWEWHCRHIMDDGQVKFLRAVAQPTPEPDGSMVWDGVIMDETPLYEAREAEAGNRQRLQTILENLAGSAVTIFDRDLHLQMCEGPLFAHLDISAMIGQPLSETSTPETVAKVVPAMQRALAGEASTVVVESDLVGRALAVRVAPYRDVDSRIAGALVHWHDITPVRQAERARDEAMDRFRIAFERAPIGMAVLGGDGAYLRVNQAFCELTGHEAGELLGMAPFELVLADHLAEAKAGFAGLGLNDDSITLEYRILHASGEPRWVQARVTVIRDQHGEPLHALAQILDITERQEHEQRLQHLADHDPLSGLLNRRGFETMLAGHLARCQRYGPSGALLVLDLDGFKRVNDALGHAGGDDLLVRCADTLRARLRDSDVVARLGGDEFAVLLPAQDAAGAAAVARSLIETLRNASAALVDEEMGPVTVSIGIAGFSPDALDSDEMLTRADLAMYEAKQGGKDRYALFGGRPVAAA